MPLIYHNYIPKNANNDLYYDGRNFCSDCIGPRYHDEIVEASMHPETLNIASRAFYGCKNLESVRGSCMFQEVREAAFGNCKKLEYVALNCREIKKEAFKNSGCENGINFKLCCRTIRKGAFENAKINNFSLISNDLELIDEEVFKGATFKNPVFHIPEGVKYMGENVFDDTNLTDVYLPDTIRLIGDSIFNDRNNFNIHMSKKLFDELNPILSDRLIIDEKPISMDELIGKYTFKQLNDKRLQKEAQLENNDENELYK